MMRLNDSPHNFNQSLDECISGITGNNVLRQKVVASKANLLHEEKIYIDASNMGGLHTIAPIVCGGAIDPAVINTLTKSDLIKLYDQYFVPEGKPARKIYDSLLNAAREKCPFCGGIGTPRNLDHFLPKTHFPQFSVLPHNLIPSCRDCNMDGKGHAYAGSAEDQIIHPYADNDRFFIDQWIFANYYVGEQNQPGEFEYIVVPPETWDSVDKKRAKKHFTDFGLATRYATKAAESLGTVLQQIQALKNADLDNATVIDTLLQPGIDKAPFINHWQRGMYQALVRILL